MGQDPDVYLSGLLRAEPMTYWDFIQIEALLGRRNGNFCLSIYYFYSHCKTNRYTVPYTVIDCLS
jgi:hypothetical protein